MTDWQIDVRNQEVAFDAAKDGGVPLWDFPSPERRRSAGKGEHAVIEVWARHPGNDRDFCFKLTTEVTTKYMKGDHVEYIGRLIRHHDVPESFMVALPTGSMLTFHDDHIRELLAPSSFDDVPTKRRTKTVATIQALSPESLMETVAEWEGGTIVFCGPEPICAVPTGSTLDPKVLATLINQLFGPLELKKPRRTDDL